jgi:hypothetical protein
LLYFFALFTHNIKLTPTATMEITLMNILSKITAASIALIAFNANLVHATTLTSGVNVDDEFNEYISSSATNLTNATLIQSGENWGQTFTATSAALTGPTEYLIIEAFNLGGPGGFLGDFSLSNTGYQFANGTQTLLTGNPGWNVSVTNLAGTSTNIVSNPYVSATNEGQNGVGPWGFQGNVNPNADWITDSTGGNPLGNGGYSTMFFETAITATQTIPEPKSIALLAAGLLGFYVSRRKNQA